MSQIIIDMGSGNTCHNDKAYIKRMYDELKAIDTGKHSICCKWQLFEKAGDNIPLIHECFDYAYNYGTSLGYNVTASVFDKNSLGFLLQFDIPFVKIANNRDLDWLVGEIPRRIPVCISYGNKNEMKLIHNSISLLCISKYPANIKDYENMFFNFPGHPNINISDHTTNFGLWYRYSPEIIEIHYKLEDSSGLDAGAFARTPKQLSEIL